MGSVFDTTTGSYAASTTSTIGPVMDSHVETSRFYIDVSNLMLSSMGSIRYQVSMIGQDIDIRFSGITNGTNFFFYGMNSS